jgi:acetyl esterase
MQALLESLTIQRAGQPDRYQLPFPEARAQLLREKLPWLADGPACRSALRTATSAGRSVEMRTYAPEGLRKDRILVYFHGGGWCVGSSATHDNIVRRLASGLACEAWSIDYALAPEAPHPAGLLDCVAAVILAAREHPDATLVLAGDSAGANLALDAALRLRDEGRRLVDALLLFYGVYTDDCSGASMQAYGDGRYGLSLKAHQRYLQAYGGATGGPLRQAVPFALDASTRLADLPPCWLMAAGLDILHDQTHALATRLRDSGVEVAVHDVPGVIHGFLSYGSALPQVAESLQGAVQWLDAMGGGSASSRGGGSASSRSAGSASSRSAGSAS